MPLPWGQLGAGGGWARAAAKGARHGGSGLRLRGKGQRARATLAKWAALRGPFRMKVQG